MGMRPVPTSRQEAEAMLAEQGWHKVVLVRHGSLPMQFIGMMVWCEENIGPGRVEIEKNRIDASDVWYSYSWYGYWDFWFRNKKDATLFTLRWA